MIGEESISSSEDTDMPISAEPQAGGSIPGGTGSSTSPVCVKNPHTGTTKLEYEKTFQIYTAGFQFAREGQDLVTTPSTAIGRFIPDKRFLVTPLAAIDPSALSLYMSSAEYKSLPPWSYATHCEIKCTPLGYRLPFATNESASTFANSQTLVQVAHGVGLNNQVNLFTTSYVSDAADLTKVSGQNMTTFDSTDVIYGSNASVGANCGIPRHWNFYTVLMEPAKNDSSSLNLLDMVSVCNINDIKGVPLVNFVHDFKNGVLKIGDDDQGGLGGNAITANGTGPIFTSRPWDSSSGLAIRQIKAGPNGGSVAGQMQMDYGTRIEKCNWFQRQQAQSMTPDEPPLIHIGVMPVQSNAALAATPTFANVVAQWMIQTRLIVHFHHNFISPAINLPYLQSWDPWATEYNLTDPGRCGYNFGSIYFGNRRVPVAGSVYTADALKLNMKANSQIDPITDKEKKINDEKRSKEVKGVMDLFRTNVESLKG